MGKARLTKSLIQFSVNGQGCVSSLLLALKPNYDGGNEYNGDLLQKVLHSVPQPCSTDMTENLENSAVITGLEKVSFHSYPKERQ